MTKSFNTAAAALTLALLCALASPDRAMSRDMEAEKFVNDLALSLSALRKKSEGLERENALKERILEAVAFRRLAAFILGPYARRIDKSTRKTYLELLPEYVTKVYLRRLLLYEGEPVVTITTSAKKGSRGREAIVSSSVKVEGWNEPLPVEWWLWRAPDGSYKVFDIGVQGFWIVQQQKAEFVSFLRKNRGDFETLLARMRAQIAKSEESGGRSAPETLSGEQPRPSSRSQ